MKTIIGRIEKENRHNRERNSLDSEKELLRSVWKGRISAFFIDFLVQQVGNIKIFPISYRYSLKGFKTVSFDMDVSLPLSYRYNLRGFDKVELPNKVKKIKIERSNI